MHLVDFHDIHLNDILPFQNKQNTCIFTRQNSEKVAYKSGLENLLERFLLSNFAQVISVFPKNLKTFLD